jgi:superfamily II DNA helicase RecQ
MFISVEHVSMNVVTTFLSQVHVSGRLSRIVVDECHLSVTWSNFRASMNMLRGLKIYPVPLVLLSATVPPRMEQQLRIHFGSQFLTIRKSTVRPELQYQVQAVRRQGDMDAMILATLRRHDEQLRSGRAIVFCLRRQETEDLSSMINHQCGSSLAGYYHGGMDPNERTITQDEWMSGSIKVMVATKAFGMGIDFPGIRVVIHKGMSSSLLDYAQETGRGGRDGQTAWCITVLNDSYCEQYISSDEEDEREKREMYEMLKSAKCYRMQLGRHVDGKGYSCGFYPRSLPCSRCSAEISCEIVDDGDASDDFLMEEFALPELELENTEQEYFRQQRGREGAPSDDDYQVEEWDEEETRM